MISEELRFLFLHVPKTAGNSIQNILRNYSEDEIRSQREYQDGVERFGVHNRRFKLGKHASLYECGMAMPAAFYASLFKLATIRNPWDRMVSLYFSPAQGRTEWSRSEFVELVNGALGVRHWVCLDPEAGGPLDRDLDLLMRFEHIEEDFAIASGRLGIAAQPLPVRNRSSHARYSDYYDDELEALVRSRFADEIAFGDYRFERP